jgi:hypothetical protein
MSLISLPPFSQISRRGTRPLHPRPDLDGERPVDDASPSHAVKPTTLMPSFLAAFRKFVATPRPYASLSFRMNTRLTPIDFARSASAAPW